MIKGRTLPHFGIMTKWCPWYYVQHPVFLVFSVWALSLRKHSLGRQKSCELKNGHNSTYKCYISLGLSIFIWRMGSEQWLGVKKPLSIVVIVHLWLIVRTLHLVASSSCNQIQAISHGATYFVLFQRCILCTLGLLLDQCSETSLVCVQEIVFSTHDWISIDICNVKCTLFWPCTATLWDNSWTHLYQYWIKWSSKQEY